MFNPTQLYKAGYVEKLMTCVNVGILGYLAVKFQVKPKQRKQDPITKLPFYMGWVIINLKSIQFYNAFCGCKGGADGTCRHVVATLFEICEYSEEIHKVSVTSQPCQWTKKRKMNESNPKAITELNLAQPDTNPKVAPVIETYDPCPGIIPNIQESFYFEKYNWP